jgi:predicted RNA-binding protein YlqC (UPF0109 family)
MTGSGTDGERGGLLNALSAIPDPSDPRSAQSRPARRRWPRSAAGRATWTNTAKPRHGSGQDIPAGSTLPRLLTNLGAAEQAVRITRTRITATSGKTSRETVYLAAGSPGRLICRTGSAIGALRAVYIASGTSRSVKISVRKNRHRNPPSSRLCVHTTSCAPADAPTAASTASSPP